MQKKKKRIALSPCQSVARNEAVEAKRTKACGLDEKNKDWESICMNMQSAVRNALTEVNQTLLVSCLAFKPSDRPALTCTRHFLRGFLRY